MTSLHVTKFKGHFSNLSLLTTLLPLASRTKPSLFPLTDPTAIVSPLWTSQVWWILSSHFSQWSTSFVSLISECFHPCPCVWSFTGSKAPQNQHVQISIHIFLLNLALQGILSQWLSPQSIQIRNLGITVGITLCPLEIHQQG